MTVMRPAKAPCVARGSSQTDGGCSTIWCPERQGPLGEGGGGGGGGGGHGLALVTRRSPSRAAGR